MELAGGVLVVGSITQDFVSSPAGDLDGELGGSATYFALAARRFCPVTVVGSVGSDREADVRATLNFADLSQLAVSPQPTYTWRARRESADGDAVTLERFTGAQDGYVPGLPADLAWPRTLFLASCDPAIQLAVLDAAPAAVQVAADTMDIFIEKQRALVEAIVRRCRVLFVTATELELLAETRGVAAAVTRVLDRYARLEAVVVKKGADGAVLWTREAQARRPAFAVDAVDPTGAGDTLAGAFLGRLSELGSSDVAAMTDALDWGIVAASFTVAAPGLRGIGAATRADVEARLEAYRRTA